MTDRPKMEIHYADGWAALYVDGQVDPDTVGDSHLAEERAFELLGVKQVQNDAFMCGQSQRDGVAPRLDDVAAYRKERDARRAEANRLRRQAAELLQQADTLDTSR
ncbi:hypothetical protein BDK92_7204 [Micromonospora pisi]|uniref:Uncharacterized protein n=1 Tax=Micromonospora pisi TaxID=589240 RepID=A0A495JUN8_9ACTN|nr:hypothetical protein [Micromonospora pisi]RKR92726.1 hypothetical protein BDK92_7204 [Micromonospora pisi]